MKIFISFIMNIILCIAYCLCIDMVNIYKPIAQMDISMGILFRIGAILMFLTLLMGMLAVRFTKRKYLMALPMIIPILLWSAYMGISVLIYLTYMAILWYYNNKSPIRQESKNMAIKLKRHKGLTIKEKSHSSAESRLWVVNGWIPYIEIGLK